jgi:hypothetical protein
MCLSGITSFETCCAMCFWYACIMLTHGWICIRNKLFAKCALCQGPSNTCSMQSRKRRVLMNEHRRPGMILRVGAKKKGRTFPKLLAKILPFFDLLSPLPFMAVRESDAVDKASATLTEGTWLRNIVGPLAEMARVERDDPKGSAGEKAELSPRVAIRHTTARRNLILQIATCLEDGASLSRRLRCCPKSSVTFVTEHVFGGALK